MKHDLIKEGYIPLDKSWMMRVGMLDILHGYMDIVFVLEKDKSLNDDLTALLRVARAWPEGTSLDVGESGTLYRFLKFASWKTKQSKEFIIRGTLKGRNIEDNPEIVNYPISELLKLDGGTSQWASAAVLLGSDEQIDNPPYKLALTYEAVRHWKERRTDGLSWLPCYDKTILRQAEAYIRALNGEELSFTPEHSEDYCFARAFNLINSEEGERRWPSLRGHESDRISEMEKELTNMEKNLPIISKDHRVVQAIAMLGKIKKQKVDFKYPDAVNKTWPQFWKFLEEVKA